MSQRTDYIIQVIEDATNVSRLQMEHKTRKGEVVIARHLAMYFIRLDDLIITQRGIGEIFGNRDHSTVIHAFEKVDAIYQTDKRYKALVDELCDKIVPKYKHLVGKISQEKYEFVVMRHINKSSKKELMLVDKSL